MIFGDNTMLFVHKGSGICIHFCVFEAIKEMLFAQQNRPPHQLKVVVAKESLADDIDVKELDIPYDWTYTTEYQGSIEQYKSQGEGIEWINCSVDSPCVVKSTDEKIDFEKLKEREPILWFDEVTLFAVY